MEIILSILQIIGIILLVIIGLILLILLIVLFVPIRYQISGKVQETSNFEGKASWLFHLLRAKAFYEDELFHVDVRILWKRISFTKDKVTSPIENQDTSSEEEALPTDNGNIDTKEPSKDNFEAGESERVKRTKKHSDILKKIINKIHRIKDKILFIKEKWEQIKKILEDKKNQLAFRHLKEELFYLIKILLPKKSMLDGTFSTGSPDTTGQLFGVICCFPIIYQDNWTITPDFEAEKAYFRGEFQGKGRVYNYQLVGILIRIIMDKNCRRLYYVINKLGGRNNGGRK